MPVLRADFELAETYQYQPAPALSCPILALGGTRDPFVRDTALRGWRQETRNSFSLKMIPGDHFFLHTEAESVIGLVGTVTAAC
jgi:medium-chain acyl-[acyl-carrier-protein] hydrolase